MEAWFNEEPLWHSPETPKTNVPKVQISLAPKTKKQICRVFSYFVKINIYSEFAFEPKA